MKHYLFILLNLCSLCCYSQYNAAIEKFISTPGFENASIGVCIKEVAGKELASYNKNLSLTPASTMKIVTTATAFEILGADYKFKTTLSQNKNNSQQIVVRGYGDPTLGSEYFGTNKKRFLNAWAKNIKNVIDTTQSISIEIDDSYFGYDGVSRKWLHEDLGNYYAAGAYGISIFDNTYRLSFNTMNTTTPQILQTEPEMKEIVFQNEMVTNTTGQDNGYISGEPFSNRRRLLGNIPAKRKSFSIKGDIPDPGLYLGQTLAEVLLKQGISIKNISTTRSYNTATNPILTKLINSEEVIFFQQESPTLREIIRVVNERSNNHYTEHLIRAVGRYGDETKEIDVLDSGISKTKSFWSDKGLNTDVLFMYDGCGLAPSDKVSPEFLCDILIYMQAKSKNSNSFFASLPKAGREGTVKNLLKDSRLEGKIFVKSGSIANVQCFAGYYVDSDKKYVFSVMVNNYNSPRKQVVKAIENLLLSVF